MKDKGIYSNSYNDYNNDNNKIIFRYKIWSKREWTIPFEEGNRIER